MTKIKELDLLANPSICDSVGGDMNTVVELDFGSFPAATGIDLGAAGVEGTS
jgi:hypothetical protein